MDLVERAQGGDPAAVEELIVSVQDRIYGLAVRMLGHVADAEDATQEILVKLATRLSSFRGDSTFVTWAYSVAINHLRSFRRSRPEDYGLSFDSFGQIIDEGAAGDPAPSGQAAVLAEEVRIVCTTGMLLCLDREHRLAYLLGEVLELAGDEAAAVLEISVDAFRMRLMRARRDLLEFVQKRCGVYDGANRCRCSTQVPYASRNGMLDPARLTFAVHSRRAANPERDEMLGLLDVAAVFRSHPDYAAPDKLVEALQKILSTHQN